jgi:Domain of unknown function (DUF1905)
VIEPLLEIAFSGEAIDWRGPAPHVFVAIPAEQVEAVRDAAREASYGWGCVPVEASANGVDFTTSLFPRAGGYMLPLKVKVRLAADLSVGDTVSVTMRISRPQRRAPEGF